MLAQIATPQVERALARQAVVALVGPRQVGKTTLPSGSGRDALYLDLEDPAEDRLVILDG